MSQRSSVVRVALGGTILVLGLATCDSVKPEEGNESISDPAVFESTMKSKFAPMMAGISDGIRRLLVASGGGAADGVVITETGTGANATISVDFDGNGSREGTINGAISGELETGAPVTIGAIAAEEPSLSGDGTFTATETAPGSILLDNMVGSGGSDPSGSRNAADVVVTDGTVALDAVAGIPDGFIDFSVTGEGTTLGIHVSFAPNGSGGYVIHFTGSGIDFTIP